MDLGFLEDCEPAWLTNRYFPSKVGGKPAWLELDKLPGHLQCTGCGNNKAFLCQIYAPYDDGEEHNFHRSIYVFICRSAICQLANSAVNLTVLRSQLPKKNLYYSEQPPEEEGEPLPAIPSKRKVCVVCGGLGPYACGRCKQSNYCTAAHQKAHWAHHKGVCCADSSKAAEQDELPLPALLFPEFEIVIEQAAVGCSDDGQTDVADEEASDAKRLEEFRQLEAAGQTGELKDVPISELDKYASSAEAADDKYFRRFQKEVKREPTQIIRYKRGGQPLWIADPEHTIKTQLDIPKCTHCQGERQFEFQLMPQLLLSLRDEQLDWGVLAVYTCARSCKPPADVGYVTEYIVKQDILNDDNSAK